MDGTLLLVGYKALVTENSFLMDSLTSHCQELNLLYYTVRVVHGLVRSVVFGILFVPVAQPV